jgi:hypothetical protein
LLYTSHNDRLHSTAPSYCLHLDGVTNLLDREEICVWECDHENEKWTFQHASIAEHRRWVKALSQASHSPVIVEVSPSQFQFKFLATVQTA